LNKSADTNLWGIHAGMTGDADRLFLKKNFIAVGWTKVGDLSVLKPNRDAFKARVAEVYQDAKPGAIPNNAGQLFRFVHEMKLGDLVVYPSKHDRQIHLGRVEGDYRYDPNTEPGYPHVRAVKWLRAVPRTQFSQGALYEIGSAMSLFLVKNYADEFHAVIRPHRPCPWLRMNRWQRWPRTLRKPHAISCASGWHRS
jgi:restriction system protein